MAMKNAPHELWRKANEVHPNDDTARALLYVELMRKAGHIVKREPGDDSPILPCGWDPRKGLDQLLSDEDRQKLQNDLAEMANLRRRAEAEARNIPLA